jgi:two-component system cell cycle response regulator DivK
MIKPRVLIVDDNPMNVELASYVLGQARMLFQSAGDATEALRQIGAFRPDLILMDIQLPGVGGLELTRRLKADPETRHIVIVAFTSYAMRDDEAKMLEAGCDGYLTKPIEVDTFAARVRAFIDAARPASAVDGG